MSKLIREQGCTEALLAQMNVGYLKAHSKNVKYKQVNENIKNLTLSFILGQNCVDDYLTGIAPNIAQPTNISL